MVRIFSNSTVNSYVVQKGVIHESFLINTPQKKGLAERKIGCILATRRALLFHAHMQKMYLGKAILTGVHLMNQIPTKLLGHQSPVNMLNYKYPIVKFTSGLAARVFGCIVYVYLKSGKLDPRPLKCVLVGYSSTQRGYRCYHPPTRKYYVSIDVTFEEYRMYFT